MPGPREAERRKAESSPDRLESSNTTIDKAMSSKRKDKEAQPQQRTGDTRARRPRSGRSGSDSNAGSGTRGH
jgi:hypothetical protein